MPTKGTTRRSFRIEDDLWTRAQARAAAAGESLSTAVRRMLEEYARDRNE